MSHRQALEALSGLRLGMLVAILSSTGVSTALPRIIADFGIVEHAYGLGVGEIFLVAAPAGILAFLAVPAIKEIPLGTKSGTAMSDPVAA
jgi:hypothetical protein